LIELTWKNLRSNGGTCEKHVSNNSLPFRPYPLQQVSPSLFGGLDYPFYPSSMIHRRSIMVMAWKWNCLWLSRRRMGWYWADYLIWQRLSQSQFHLQTTTNIIPLWYKMSQNAENKVWRGALIDAVLSFDDDNDALSVRALKEGVLYRAFTITIYLSDLSIRQLKKQKRFEKLKNWETIVLEGQLPSLPWKPQEWPRSLSPDPSEWWIMWSTMYRPAMRVRENATGLGKLGAGRTQNKLEDLFPDPQTNWKERTNFNARQCQAGCFRHQKQSSKFGAACVQYWDMGAI